MMKHKHCHLRHLELLIPLDAADLNDQKTEGNWCGGCKGFEKMVGKLIAEVSFAAGESV
jgi:hypothetical protein